MAKRLRDMTEPELREYMTLLAKATESVLPEGSRFALLVFEDAGMAQYVSNCGQSNIIKAMRETANRLEKRSET